LIRDVTSRLLNQSTDEPETHDPVVISITEGKRRALRHVLREVMP
jgi:hypothetical protein